MRKYFAEGICTALLIFFGCLAASLLFSGIGVLGVALSFGLVYLFCYYTLGKLSGCHLNPAVSLAAFLTKKIEIKQFCFYILAQFLGAIVGAFFCFALITMSPDGASVLFSTHWLNSFGAESLSGTNAFGAILLEIILTFIFVLAYLKNHFDPDKKAYCGVVISLAYVLVVLLGFNLTGACVNPARCLGPAFIVMFTGSFGYILQFFVFLFATSLGSFLAVLVYRKIFED